MTTEHVEQLELIDPFRVTENDKRTGRAGIERARQIIADLRRKDRP